ncbi:MAG: flagellar biosynthetic protein FliO [Candidatus Calescibacterium sp.]|jgi:flagellar biogenesis protein FliO|nr:flagellar biosynthetic protein FliO [Candidatus Calescibacterium sp.]
MEIMGFLLKIFISIFVLAAFLFGSLLIMKKKGIFFPPLMNDNNNIQVQSHIKLTPKAHLFVVKIDQTKILVGVTEKNISFYQMKEKESE